MKSRDAVIGFIFIAILILGAFWIYKARAAKKAAATPIPTPNIVDRVNSAFPNLKIPDGSPRANLNDVSGGTNVGVATKTEVVANLPTPPAGQSYKAQLVNSEGKVIELGTLRDSKSGWIISYDSTKYPGYNKVVVLNGSTPVLEGSF